MNNTFQFFHLQTFFLRKDQTCLFIALNYPTSKIRYSAHVDVRAAGMIDLQIIVDLS